MIFCHHLPQLVPIFGNQRLPVWSMGSSLVPTVNVPEMEIPFADLLTALISGRLFIYKGAIPIKVWNFNPFRLSIAKAGKDHQVQWKTIQNSSSSKQTQACKVTMEWFSERPWAYLQGLWSKAQEVTPPPSRPGKAKLCFQLWVGALWVPVFLCLACSTWIPTQ